MKVKILTSTPHALRTAFTSIRTCYSAFDQEYVWNEDYENYKSKNNDHLRLVKQIVSHGHLSTLEHISFTFAINDVSRSLLAQLTRHRVGFAYSVQSQRYVNLATDSKSNGFTYTTPDAIKSNDKALKEFEEVMKNLQDSYNSLRELGVKAEDSRSILPNAANTNITLTCNLRAFLDLYGKRNKTTHAQGEIADLVEMMRESILEIEPWIADLF